MFGLNLLMLLGLVAVVIPPIIHLLNRRRYEVIDWGAMQFLQVSQTTRRRILLEEILLMLVRMGLLALVVLGLASPWVESQTLAKLGGRPNRDVVLIFDGSASMATLGEEKSPHDAAVEWARKYLKDLQPGDGVAVLQAKQQVVPVVGSLSSDLEKVRQQLDKLPPPSGGADWPQAMQEAYAVLANSKKATREVIVLSDGQKYGWADDTSLLRWGLAATHLGVNKPSGSVPRPHVHYVNLAADRKASLPNWGLAPLVVNRPVMAVNRDITFRSAFVIQGQSEYKPPHKLRVEIDGKPARDLTPPQAGAIEKGRIPFSFTHKFASPGSHLVSVVLEVDPPPGERDAGTRLRDQIPGDNRQDFAVEVLPAVPVLLVDGDPTANLTRRGTDFLRDALAPAIDKSPSVQVKVITVAHLDAAALSGDEQFKPRVVVLSNVAKLSEAQRDALGNFLAEGGGVLVTLGNRVDAEDYNKTLFRGGQGWLPAQLNGTEGDETKPREAARPAPVTSHPVLDVFRNDPQSLASATFPRWWKLTMPGPNAPGTVAASLRTTAAEYPWLIDRPYKGGRMILCAVALDNSWGTNLPNLPAFVPLVHEMVYHLAGTRSIDFNLAPGQPLRYRLDEERPLHEFTLQPPGGEPRPLGAETGNKGIIPAQMLKQPRGAVLTVDALRDTGVYRLKTPDNGTVYYVTPGDPREADLTPATDDDRALVAKVFPMDYVKEPDQLLAQRTTAVERKDVWVWFFVGVLLLLCVEVFMTRRMVQKQEAA